MARAALESIAFQTMEILNAMESDSNIKISELRVDGGATADDLLMQVQSDILDARVVRPAITETTAMGAAYLAGLATGFWNSIEEIEKQWKVERVFKPAENVDTKQMIMEWHRAVRAAKSWADNVIM
jgi:glycerol kinase